MDLLLHFKVNEGDENNINIQEYKLYGDVEIKCEKCLVDEGDEYKYIAVATSWSWKNI